MEKLTYREKQIIMYINQGYSNQEIASKLFTSIGTIKTTLQKIRDKTGIANRVGLAIMYERSQSLQTIRG